MRTIQAWSLMMLVMAMAAFGQTASDLGEGLRAELTSTSGVTAIKWWGKPGRTYFVQSSETLLPDSWQYMPVVEAGTYAVHTWNLQTSASKMFVRLVYTDQLYAGTAGDADFDGDGLSNAQEVAVDGPGTDPLNADSDADGDFDGLELENGMNPVGSQGYEMSQTFETGFKAFGTTMAGYYKQVSNNWYGGYGAPPSYVSWSSSAPQSAGGETYSDFSPRWGSKLDDLHYPPHANGMFVPWYIRQDAMVASTEQTTSAANQTGSMQLNYFKTSLSSSPLFQAQPWDVTRHKLFFVGASAFPGSSMPEYRYVSLLRFTIPEGSHVSEPFQMEPAVEDHMKVQAGLLSPEVATTQHGIDLVANSQGIYEPWISVPAESTKLVNLSGGVGDGNHRWMYRFFGVVPVGVGVENGNEVRVPFSPANWITLVPEGMGGGEGAVHAGVAYGDTGVPAYAMDEPLMRIQVLRKKMIRVTVHPITLLAPNGSAIAQPVNCPSATALQSYLNGVIGEQANVHSTVTVMPVQAVNWDVGIGHFGLSFGAGNQGFDILDNFTGNKNYDLSDEEKAVQEVSPPDATAEVNVYYIASPNPVELAENKVMGGMAHMVYASVDSPFRQPGIHMKPSYVHGYAGRAEPDNNGLIYVRDYAQGLFDPHHRCAIAHEIVHYLGALGHSTEPGANNFGRNTDLENRLMTGRLGVVRGSSPTRLSKFEWECINELRGPNGLPERQN